MAVVACHGSDRVGDAVDRQGLLDGVKNSIVKCVGDDRSPMKIYTGRGDEGMTDLHDMSRVSKASPRIEAYGTVDELNALIGTIRPTGYDDVDEKLEEAQNHLHVVQADLANPDPDEDDPVVQEEHVESVEEWIDEYDDELEPLERFVLPTGSETGAALHHTRTVCRRAERRVVALASEEEINEEAVQYLNRLSDGLFTWARVVNQRDGVPEDNPTY
ncbi:MAG: cob(I)alamin adenosyltransferase [Natronomonas sp.]|jgi:cob(I)alamin adenosyltransferase